MTEKLKIKLLNITKELIHIPDGKNKHLTFILNRNRIVSVGWNLYYKTHVLCHKLGYRFDAIHSEVSAILRYRHPIEDLRFCTFVNTRMNTLGEVGISKPCEICQKLLNSLNIKKIWYTNRTGDFERLYLDDNSTERISTTMLIQNWL